MHAPVPVPVEAAWTPTTLQRGDALAFAAAPSCVFVSIYDEDHCGVYRSSDEGVTWVPARAGLPYGASVTTLLWHAGRLVAGTVACGLYASSDAGATWARLGAGMPPHETIFGLAARGDVLFAATESAGVFRSTDGGATWAPANRGLPFGGKGLGVFTLAADGATVYVHHLFGLHRSTDDGCCWEAVGMGLPAHTTLTLLAAYDGHLFVGSPGYLFHSPDGGVTWTARAGGLWERRLIRALVLHEGILYAGTQGTADSGLFASSDGGFTWTALHEGLPPETWSVNLFVAGEHLLAGAGSHGVWCRPVRAAEPAGEGAHPAPFILAQNDPNPFEERTTITFSLPHAQHVVLEVCDLLGAAVQTLVDGPVAGGEHAVPFDAGDLPGGFYFYRLTVGSVSQTRQMLLLR